MNDHGEIERLKVELENGINVICDNTVMYIVSSCVKHIHSLNCQEYTLLVGNKCF